MIQKQAVDVPPAVLLFSVAAGTIFGFLGVLLAAPLTVVFYVIVQRAYVKTLLYNEVLPMSDARSLIRAATDGTVVTP